MNFTPENFCYWLQGYFEIVQHTDHREGLPEEALEEIKNHLALVFKKETPRVGIMTEADQEQIMPLTRWPDSRLLGDIPGTIRTPYIDPKYTTAIC